MEDKVTVRVLFFAKARELLDRPRAFVSFPIQLRRGVAVQCLESAFPDLCQLKGSFMIAVNEEYLEENADITVSEGDELAVIPPISGG